MCKPKQRTFRVYRQFDVISNATTNKHNAFVMVPPAEGYESAMYSAELVPCKKVKFDAAILALPAAELDPPQPQTPPKESTIKVSHQAAPMPPGDGTCLSKYWERRTEILCLQRGAGRDAVHEVPASAAHTFSHDMLIIPVLMWSAQNCMQP